MAEFMMVLLTMSLQASLVMLLVLMMRKVFNLVHIAKKYVMLLWTIPFYHANGIWNLKTAHLSANGTGRRGQKVCGCP